MTASAAPATATAATATAATAAAARPTAAVAAAGIQAGADGWETVTPPNFITGTGNGGTGPVNTDGNQAPPVSSADSRSNAIWENLNAIVAKNKGLKAKLPQNMQDQLDRNK